MVFLATEQPTGVVAGPAGYLPLAAAIVTTFVFPVLRKWHRSRTGDRPASLQSAEQAFREDLRDELKRKECLLTECERNVSLLGQKLLEAGHQLNNAKFSTKLSDARINRLEGLLLHNGIDPNTGSRIITPPGQCLGQNET